MSIQDMEDLKQLYLNEMKSMINQIQIKDYRNERIDIRYRKECEIKIDELNVKFNGMSTEINRKKELWQLEQAANLMSDLPSCNDFSPINVSEEKSVTFYNPLFNSNDDFTSSNDESLSDEDVPKDNVKIYSNPLFEFDDEYISSDINPLFNEVLEDIESEDSYVYKLDEPDLLVTPLSKLNEDECFDHVEGDILLLEKLLNDDPSSPLPPKELNFEELKVIKSDVSTDFEEDYYDSEGDIIYLVSLLIKDTIPNLHPEVFLDDDPRSLEDKPDNKDLKSMVKVFDPEIPEKFFSPTYVSLSFEDRHYLSLTYVIRIFLPYFTYPVESPFLLSSGSEDTIFDPDIFAFHFSSLKRWHLIGVELSCASMFIQPS
ncbi:hypothetical protein Tco_1446858 [Tanacetum coccineum]